MAFRVVLFACALVAALGWFEQRASAEPIHIHVRGSATLQAFAAGEPGGFSIEGEIDDDAGTPIAHAPLVVSPTVADGLTITSLEPCRATLGGRPRAHGPADGFTLEANDAGGFCVLGKTTSAKGNVKIHFAGDKLHDAADLEVAIDADKEQRVRTLLRFESTPETIDLDRDAFAVTVSLRIDRAEGMRNAAASKREGLELTLDDERGTRLAAAKTGGDGRAHFEVKTSVLAPPGSGALVVRFAGNETLARAELTERVIRRAEARLTLAHPPAPADPDDGATIDVKIATSRGDVEGGVVEAVSNGASVGAAPVQHGNAKVFAAVLFPSNSDAPVKLALRFVPGAPYFKAGPELATEVRVATPNPIRHIAIALVVVALAVWVVAGWRRAPKSAAAPGRETVAPPSGRPGVAVLAQPAGITGWRGVVTDAHEGTPIAHARLRMLAPAFEGDSLIAETKADANGAFTLEGERPKGARLIVDSELHSSYEQAMPPPSVLGIALVTRRRALLDRLVRWARRNGAPYDAAPEPTPGHVRRVAARADAIAVAAWAERVEEAAFGGAPVGSAVEKDIRHDEPSAGR